MSFGLPAVLVFFSWMAAVRPACAATCAGDCGGDGRVSVEEVVTAVNIGLGILGLDACRSADTDGDQRVEIAELVTAVGHGLRGCPSPFEEKLATLRWLAYAPTGFDPRLGCPGGYPGEKDIREDLEVAQRHGFDGLITFASDCSLAAIPRLAVEVGFRGVIMGLFLFDQAGREAELSNAVAARAHVDGYGVGNEGLIGCGGTLYDRSVLVATMAALRAATGRPVTTSEQIEDYLDGGCLDGFLLETGDWLFPITHPFNNGIRDPEAGASFTAERYRRLDALTAKPILFKETGWPTAGDPAANEANQETYFLAVEARAVRFAYFEGFDQPFKESFGGPWEPFWGLFRQDRSAKQFIAARVQRE
jgi:glucan 1,3-beta-glucosidase